MMLHKYLINGREKESENKVKYSGKENRNILGLNTLFSPEFRDKNNDF